MFDGLKENHIKCVHLTGNQFKNFDCTIFQPLARLERSHLANNKIEHIVLKEFRTLLKLELNNNFLDIVPSFCVSLINSSSLLPNVRTLDLSNNYITTFNKHAFVCLPRVKVLILDRLNVNILPTNIFDNMKWLRHLTLNLKSLKIMLSIVQRWKQFICETVNFSFLKKCVILKQYLVFVQSL